MSKISTEIDRDYFIRDCSKCEHVKAVSIDKITIDKMYCGLTDREIVDTRWLCKDFKIAECVKLVDRISDEEAERIEAEVKSCYNYPDKGGLIE